MKIIIFLILSFFIFAGNASASKKIIDRSFLKNEYFPLKNSVIIQSGEKYNQEILVSENNFGMLDLLVSMKNIDDDGVVFRIKESSQESWDYENFYDAEFFTQGLFYSFGFPPYLDSANKTYFIELELVDENKNNEAKIYLLDNQDLAWRAAIDEPFSKILKENFKTEFSEKWQTQQSFFNFWFALLAINLLAIVSLLFIKKVKV